MFFMDSKLETVARRDNLERKIFHQRKQLILQLAPAIRMQDALNVAQIFAQDANLDLRIIAVNGRPGLHRLEAQG
jgi:hypothetical protein